MPRISLSLLDPFLSDEMDGEYAATGMTPEECLFSSNSSYARSFNTRDHPQSIISTGTG
jgi:hypothetical protein